jgi:RNA polymerase sigma-70 factor (ECF subfamily)
LRTWVYRVAHNVATSHMIHHRRHNARQWVSLDALETEAHHSDAETVADRQMMLEELQALIEQLNPPDRQLMLLYLEGLDAASIGEITGLSPGNVATRIHRIKKIIADRVREGGHRDG